LPADYDDMPDDDRFEDGPEDGSDVALIPGAFPRTDTGNAERFAARFRGDARYCAERKRWLFWCGSHWAWDATGEIGRRVKTTVRGVRAEAASCSDMNERKELFAWAAKSEGASRRGALEALAQCEPGIAITVDELDRDPWLLNCLNGTLNLRTGRLQPHISSDLITKSTGVAYRKGANTELWNTVLNNLHQGDDELHRYLQRIAGYALTGLSTEKKFFFLCGPPDGGKSSYLNALLSCMGSYARTTPFETWVERPNIGGNRDDLVSLQGVRLVVSGEVRSTAHWDTATIKAITGGDRISASAKYESQIEFTPQCTILLAANDAPKARDDDEGFWRRMQRIPINGEIPKEQQLKNVGELLREEANAEAALAWAVEGCRMWVEDGGIGTAKVVEESTAAYREDNDWIGGFLESYEQVEDSVIPAANFRSQYEDYCKREGQKAEATKTLAKRIEKRCPGVRYLMVRGARMWRGLQLRSPVITSESYVQTELPVDPMPPEELF
jgi:putative DNA primase/helicase